MKVIQKAKTTPKTFTLMLVSMIVWQSARNARPEPANFFV